MSTTYNQYQEFVSTLFKEHHTLEAEQARVLDWSLGLCEELFEVAEVIMAGKHVPIDQYKLTKELGDVFWYFTALCATWGQSLTEMAAWDTEPPFMGRPGYHYTQVYGDLLAAAKEITSIVKHEIFHGETITSAQRVNALKKFAQQLWVFTWGWPFTPAEVLHTNYEKLSHRYNAGKFNTIDSAKRAEKEAEFDEERGVTDGAR